MNNFPRYNTGALTGQVTAYATVHGHIQKLIQDNPDTTVADIQELVYSLYTNSKRKVSR